jgi:hypothetical protein
MSDSDEVPEDVSFQTAKDKALSSLKGDKFGTKKKILNSADKFK